MRIHETSMILDKTTILIFTSVLLHTWAMVSILKPKSTSKFRVSKVPKIPKKQSLFTRKMHLDPKNELTKIKTTHVKLTIDSPLHQESMMFECLWGLSAHSSVGKADCSSWSWNPAGIPIKKMTQVIDKTKGSGAWNRLCYHGRPSTSSINLEAQGVSQKKHVESEEPGPVW